MREKGGKPPEGDTGTGEGEGCPPVRSWHIASTDKCAGEVAPGVNDCI
jgi:hypothetical protein